MSRKVRIILTVIISAVLLLGSLTACGIGKGNTSKTKDDEFDAFNADAKKEDLKEATLTFYFPVRNDFDMKDVLTEIEKKSKEELNIKLDFKWIYNWESFLNIMKDNVNSGSPCDAFAYSLDMQGETLRSLAKSGVIMDISEYFPKYAPKFFKRFSQEELNAAKVDGKLYAVPNSFTSIQRKCILVRDDFMKKYDIPDIKNYDDYEVYLKTIKEKEKDIIPISMYDAAIGLFAEMNGYVIMDYSLGLVYRWNDPDMKLIAWEQTPEYKKSIDIINKWNKNGFFLKDVGFIQPDEGIVTSGKYGSIIGYMDSEAVFNTMLKSRNISGWKYKSYPLYPEKPSAINSPMYGALLVSSKSPNAERLMRFLNWLQSSQENYDLLMYGIKGKHYQLYGEQFSFPEGVRSENAYTNWPGRWVFRNIDFERTSVASDPDFKKKYLESLKFGSKYPPHMGFYPELDPTDQTVGLRRSSFFRIEQSIFYNSFNEGDIEEYIKEQKEYGTDKLVANVQKQLDKWRTEK